MRRGTDHYVALEVDNKTFTRMRHTPQLNWRLPTISRGYQNSKNLNNRLGHSKYPRGTSSRALQVTKSNKLLNFNFHVSLWRTQTDATDVMARTHEVVKILQSQIPPKQLILWRNKKEKTSRKSTNESQDLDPKASPHLEERLIGVIVDLDLLSLFPSIRGKNHAGIERKQATKG